MGGSESLLLSTARQEGVRATVYGLIFVASAATLALEICLTRVFALAHWYHFASMSISIGLLGFGASGSLLYLRPRLLEERHTTTETWSSRSSTERSSCTRGVALANLLLGAAIPTTYLGANALPLDAYLLGIEPIQWAYLVGYFGLLALPFIFAGLAVGFALSQAPERAARIYFANLAGSALGAAAPLALLNLLPPGEAVVSIAAGVAITSALWALLRRSALLVPALLLLAGIGGLGLLAPDHLAVRTSPYKALNQALLYPGSQVAWRAHNAFSQVELLKSAGIRSAPGLSVAFEGRLPPQYAVSTDGENLSPVISEGPQETSFTRYLPSAAAYRLLASGPRQAPPSVLVLEPAGGLETLVALDHGAGPLTVVAGNPLQMEAVRQVAGSYPHDPRVQLLIRGPRSFMAANDRRFDLIVMPLNEGFRVVTAGAFAVNENYLLTVESLARQYESLAEEGFLVITRWLQLPPSEELRAFILVLEALERSGVERPSERVAAFRSFQTATMLVKRGELRGEEIRELRSFAAEMRYDLIYLPGLQAAESNRFNVLEPDPYFESFALAPSREQRPELLHLYPYDVRAPTDDHPFFFHFFRPSQLSEVIQKLGRTWQPFGGSGYLVMFALLAFLLAASGLLIVAPLAARRDHPEVDAPGGAAPARLRLAVLAYFLALGVAYLFLELPLMQRMILFLDQPTYAFSAVLFVLLLFSGLGSLASERLRWRLRWVLVALVGGAAIYSAALPHLLAPFLGQPLAFRFLVAVAILAPLGLLMGMPFPRGIALTGRAAPSLVPWAWGINGFASVISTVLASMIALGAGFGAVMALAGAAYAVAVLAVGAVPAAAPEPMSTDSRCP